MAAIQYESIEAMGQDHYDACIVGVWYGLNYGSTLTYYALQKAIREMGYSVNIAADSLLHSRIGLHPVAR